MSYLCSVKVKYMANKLTRKDKFELYTRVSKYFEDISKLVFGGVILASIMREDIETMILVGSGVISLTILLGVSYVTYKASRRFKN